MNRLLLSAAVLVSLGAPLAADDKSDATAHARALLDALLKEDYDAASKDFDEAMKKNVPTDKLKEVWKSVLRQSGPFKSVVATNVEARGRAQVVTLTCQFEKAAIDVNVAVDGKEVIGLNIRPNAKVGYKAPDYVKADAFREVEVTVNPGEWELPGTLTLPKGDGPFPAVVLVHGSGPHDRDESVGPNQPFRDLAGGLASKGVAVLRYEKRTKQHGFKLVKQNLAYTIKEEAVDDAAAAAALLRARKEIDPKRVYVLGHSLGGHLAPLIAGRDGELAGLILLAGNSRPLTDLVPEQYDYLLSLLENASDEEKKQVEDFAKQLADFKKQAADTKKTVARLKDPKLEETSPSTEQILGAPVSYWVSLREYDAAATAAKVKAPVLVLQGERDYQVTMTDFDGWKKALKGHDNVRFKAYPKLNHLFAEGEGKSRPTEYQQAKHVSAEVIDDIADWIKKR
jgi:dienelactone hydrolase